MIRHGEGLKDLFDKLTPAELSKLQKERVLPNKWYIQRNRRLYPDEPSVTVTSHCIDEMLHPDQDRALTVREVARLQSFPDFYEFPGGPYICPHIYETQDKYEQIGDCVPPLLAHAWGTAIRMILAGETDRQFTHYGQQLEMMLLRERGGESRPLESWPPRKVNYRKITKAA